MSITKCHGTTRYNLLPLAANHLVADCAYAALKNLLQATIHLKQCVFIASLIANKRIRGKVVPPGHMSEHCSSSKLQTCLALQCSKNNLQCVKNIAYTLHLAEL